MYDDEESVEEQPLTPKQLERRAKYEHLLGKGKSVATLKKENAAFPPPKDPKILKRRLELENSYTDMWAPYNNPFNDLKYNVLAFLADYEGFKQDKLKGCIYLYGIDKFNQIKNAAARRDFFTFIAAEEDQFATVENTVKLEKKIQEKLEEIYTYVEANKSRLSMALCQAAKQY